MITSEMKQKWFDEFCKNCPDRKVGCHNLETCSKWAEHEKKKEKAYKDRRNWLRKYFREVQNDHI